MGHEVFDTVAWDDVAEALKEWSKMLKRGLQNKVWGFAEWVTGQASGRNQTRQRKRRS